MATDIYIITIVSQIDDVITKTQLFGKEIHFIVLSNVHKKTQLVSGVMLKVILINDKIILVDVFLFLSIPFYQP